MCLWCLAASSGGCSAGLDWLRGWGSGGSGSRGLGLQTQEPIGEAAWWGLHHAALEPLLPLPATPCCPPCSYPSDDINKFLWMVRIGGGVFPEIKEPNYLGSDGGWLLGSLCALIPLPCHRALPTNLGPLSRRQLPCG